jgi:hypothetical protein
MNGANYFFAVFIFAPFWAKTDGMVRIKPVKT